MGSLPKLLLLLATGTTGCEKLLDFSRVADQNQSPRALVFSGATGASDLKDFPVLVSLDDTNFDYSVVADPTHDIRFHDEVTNADLAFEIDHWDPSGTSALWVKVPEIHQPTDRILMYFGPTAGGSAMPQAVWSDYALVFHGDAMMDSTGHSSPQPVNDIPPPAPGMIGLATVLSGVDGTGVDFVNSATILANWPMFTLELWVEPQYMPDPINLGSTPNPPNPPNPTQARIIDKPAGGVQGGHIRNSITGQATPFVMGTDFSFNTVGTIYDASFYMPDNTWSQVTFAYDHQTVWSYRNGVVLDLYANDAPDTTLASTYDLYLGTNGALTPLTGMIDEVRLSQTYHDTDWVAMQYLSMTGKLITFENP